MTLEAEVVSRLKAKGYSLGTAESCTGGMLSAKLIDVSGASAVFKVGHVTYANEAKEEILGVSRDALENFGAVSKEVAKEMVEGLVSNSNVNVGISITGIAGPLGGTVEKPVGTVFMGCSVNGDIKVNRYLFEGTRMEIRESAVREALIFMKQCIE